MAFTFPAMVAWDSIGKQSVKSTSFQVYAMADTGFVTPLAITDPFGAALPGNILNSGTQAVFPEFMQADHPTVRITDAARNYVWTITSVIQDESVAGYVNTTTSVTRAALDTRYQITPGTTAQYYRGDKTWQTLNKAAAGLGNVDNTSDAAKPVSTAQLAAIATKGPNILPDDLSLAAHGGWTLDTTNTPIGVTKAFSTTVSKFLGVAGSTGFIAIDETRTYRYSFDIHSNQAGQVTFMDMNWRTKANTAISTSPRILSNYTIPNNVWTSITGYIGAGMGVIPPAGTAGFCPLIYANHVNGTQGGILTIADFRIVDVTDVAALVRGTEHLATPSLNGVMPAADKTKLDALTAPATADVTYYVSTTGSNSNNGLTSGAALLTIQEAVNRAADRSLFRDIKVNITVAAGSYNGRIIIPEFTENRLNIVIQGPEVAHPGVPTVTQTEGTNASASAIVNRNPNTKLTVRNIHFTGYRGTSSSSGITVTRGSQLFTENCHFTDCFWGISGQSSTVDVKGGIFTRCGFLGVSGTGTGAGVRSLMGTMHAIGAQGAGNLTAGPNFVDCKTGVHVQETSTGHVDWSTFTNCERGVILRVNSRANVDGSSFTGATVGVTIETGSNAFIPAATVFSGCTNNYVVNSSGSVSTTDHSIVGVEESYVRQEAIAWGKYTSTTHTGTLTETDLANLTLKGGVWRENGFAGTNAPAARLRIQTSGTLNGTAGTKTIRIRYGTGVVSVPFPATEVGTFVFDGYITFTAASQIMRAEGRRHLGGVMRIDTAATTAADVTVDQAVRLTAELGATADSIILTALEVSRA